ncbi:MAG: ATP-binding cassette domain-containing protein [Planctomycetota bacterium]
MAPHHMPAIKPPPPGGIPFAALPEEVAVLLGPLGINREDVEVVMGSDLDMEGRPHPSWLIVTAEQVVGVVPGYSRENGVFGPYKRSQIDKVRVFRGVGSNFLQVRLEGLFIDMIRFSNRRREEFDRVRLYLEQPASEAGDRFAIFRKPHPWICPKCGLGLPGRNATCPRCAREGALFIRTLSLMRPYLVYVVGLISLMLCGVALDLVPPFLTRMLVDDVLSRKEVPVATAPAAIDAVPAPQAAPDASRPGGGTPAPRPLYVTPEEKAGKLQMLMWLVLALAGASLTRAGLNILIGRISTTVGTRVTYNLRTRLHEKLATLSVDFHDRSSLGNLITRVLHDVDYFHGFVQQMAQGFFVNVLLVVGIGVMLFWLNPALALYVLIPIPFVVVGTWFFWHIIYPRYYRFWDSNSKLAALLNGMLSGIRTVKAYAQEEREFGRFQNAAGASRDARRALDQGTTTFLPLFGFVFGLGGLIIWYAGGHRVLEGFITLGTLMAFLGYVGMFYGPISAMTMFSNWFTGFLTAGQRIFEILDTPSSIQPPEKVVPLPTVKGRIEFRHVTFGYDPYQPVLKDIHFTIEPGQMVGIVGKSGSGKTTLINLVCRFYDPQQGQVFIDGVDVRDLDNDELRRHVGLVLQEPFLFRATIAENIAYGRPDAVPRAVIDAACAANCHTFIMQRALGYDTRLGERGAGLSGGERQRVSIARALLCDPAILILDEATSNVDTESEQAIQKSLAVLVKGRTTIVIAHRLSTLKNADIIYVVDDGKIIEHGTHEALMTLQGHYHNLVMIQTQLTKLEG